MPQLYRHRDDRDHDLNGAIADPSVVEEAWQAWHREAEHAERYVEGLASVDIKGTADGGGVELRDVLVHMIEEYAPHAGHADLLRDCIDDRTGQ